MRLWDMLFGCWHKHLSFPISGKRGTYVVCLDCGQEFAYDWKQMRIVRDNASSVRAKEILQEK